MRSCFLLTLAASLRHPRQIAANASAINRFAKLPMTCIWDRYVRPPTHWKTVARTSDIVSDIVVS